MENPELRALNIFGAFGVFVADRVFDVIDAQGQVSRQEGIALIQIGLFSPGFANLQTTLRLTQSAASRLVNRLAEKMLIAKESISGDPREKRIALTAQGESLMRDILENRYVVLREIVQGLTSDEKETLLALMTKILERNITTRKESDVTCRMCDLGNCSQECCPAQPEKECIQGR